MAETNYKDAIPTLKDEIEHATVESVLALDVDKYKYGFETSIESDKAPKGLNEDTIRFISKKKDEPEWMLEWRLEAYRREATFHPGLMSLTMTEHERILQAILAMDEASASTQMRGHLDTLRDDVVSMATAMHRVTRPSR